MAKAQGEEKFGEERGKDFEEDSIFSEYRVDDSLSLLDRLKKYISSDFHLQRKMLAKSLYDVCVEVGPEVAAKEVFPLIPVFLRDPDPLVREALAEQIYPLSVFFNDFKGYVAPPPELQTPPNEKSSPTNTNNNNLNGTKDSLQSTQNDNKINNDSINNNNNNANRQRMNVPLLNPQVQKTISNNIITGSSEDGYKEVTNRFLPLAYELIIDKKSDVSEAATCSLIKIAKLIKPSDVEKQVFDVIKSLAKIEEVEVYRISGAKLFNLLAPVFGERLCCDKVVAEIIGLSKDTAMTVRKTLATYMHHLCEVVGMAITEKYLMPVYSSLIKDDVWGVRKAAVEVLPIMAKCVSMKCREEKFVKFHEELSEDVSRWVKLESFKKLGKLIACFSPDLLTQKLNSGKTTNDSQINNTNNSNNSSPVPPNNVVNNNNNVNPNDIVDMSNLNDLGVKVDPKSGCDPSSLVLRFVDILSHTDNTQQDSELSEYTAYNFSSVVKVLGKENWYLFEKPLKNICKDVQWKVRRVLAFYMADLAKTLGSAIVETTLIDVFGQLLRDLDDVKYGAVFCLSKFLKEVPPNKRSILIDNIVQIPEETDNWRIKEMFASQLAEVLELYEKEEKSRQKLLKSFLTLLQDDFAVIRKSVAKQAGEFFKILYKMSTNIIKKSDAQDSKQIQQPNSNNSINNSHNSISQDQINLENKNVTLGEDVVSFITFIKGFISKSCFERSLYIDVCESLITALPREIFGNYFLGGILAMENEGVTVVKIKMAKFINNCVLQNEFWKDDPDILRLKSTLQNDDDPDVQFFTSHSIVNAKTSLQNMSVHKMNFDEKNE